MLKIVAAAGTAALFLAASPLAYGQAPSSGVLERLSAGDANALTDARINVVKAALQLTPEQEKYWPSIEDAIRVRARDRQARIAEVTARIGELRERSPLEALRDRNPVDFMQRRAAALTERAVDLKKLADAWQPQSWIFPIRWRPRRERRLSASRQHLRAGEVFLADTGARQTPNPGEKAGFHQPHCQDEARLRYLFHP